MAKLQNEFSWSVSRDRVFRDCRRQYYYQYYGSWGGWERDADDRTRLLYILKNIKSLPMWAGSIVHETIARALNTYARTGREITAGALQAEARNALRAGWVEAVRQEWRQTPKKNNLHELYYGNGKSLPKEQTDRTRDRINDALAAFAESPVLREILTVPYLSWKPVDTLDSFNLDGLKIWAAVDFAYTDPAGVLRIIDWKTGSENRESLRTQLCCYALYANEAWFQPLDSIRLHGIFLGDNARNSEYRVSPEMIVAAKDEILTGAAEMRELLEDPEANRAREESFPCCEEERTCRFCNFREVCPAVAGNGNPAT